MPQSVLHAAGIQADSPDLLHPGDAGYRLMAQAFDLAVFATGR